MNSSPKRSLTTSLSLFLVLGTLLIASGQFCIAAESPHLTMGNPNQATTDVSQKNNFLIVKDNYVLSYNDSRGTPNWVSWRLTRKDIGKAPRFPFEPDESLPGGFRVVTPKDYAGSGFDRGHMCPHSDRSADNDMSRETFLMSNIVPQSPYVNQKAWAQLEIYCRDLAEIGHKTLYIVCGPAGQGGEGSKGRMETIGPTNKVVVPLQCWKVILVLDALRAGDPKKVAHARVISVIIPNDMSVGDDWAHFRRPMAEVEQLTGYKFFDRVPQRGFSAKRDQADHKKIPPPRPIHFTNDN